VVSGALALVVAILVIMRSVGSHGPRPRPVASLPKVAGAQVQRGAPAISIMSDQEVVACFPPGSCFIAEVEGRKVLVFPDPILRQRYLH
jgi:hypothetical protein